MVRWPLWSGNTHGHIVVSRWWDTPSACSLRHANGQRESSRPWEGARAAPIPPAERIRSDQVKYKRSTERCRGHCPETCTLVWYGYGPWWFVYMNRGGFDTVWLNMGYSCFPLMLTQSLWLRLCFTHWMVGGSNPSAATVRPFILIVLNLIW